MLKTEGLLPPDVHFFRGDSGEVREVEKLLGVDRLTFIFSAVTVVLVFLLFIFPAGPPDVHFFRGDSGMIRFLFQSLPQAA